MWKCFSIGFLVLVVGCTDTGHVEPVKRTDKLKDVGVVHNYKPKKPIDFPHDIHTGKGGIDCKYCHNATRKSSKAGLPTVYLCTNCHKTVKGRVNPAK